MVFDLEKDIIREINKKNPTISYNLSYVLKTDQLENLKTLVENAPTAYSIEIMKSTMYPSGIFLRMVRLEEA